MDHLSLAPTRQPTDGPPVTPRRPPCLATATHVSPRLSDTSTAPLYRVLPRSDCCSPAPTLRGSTSVRSTAQSLCSPFRSLPTAPSYERSSRLARPLLSSLAFLLCSFYSALLISTEPRERLVCGTFELSTTVQQSCGHSSFSNEV